MPCNSAHIYFEQLAAGMHVPLLNMIDVALAALPAASNTVALLATRPTVEARIYQDAIERAGKRLLVGEVWQARVDALILAIKSSADRAGATCSGASGRRLARCRRGYAAAGLHRPQRG